MSLDEATTLVPLVAAGCYTSLLIVSYVRRPQQVSTTRWLMLLLLLSIAWEFLILFVPDIRLQSTLSVKAQLLSLTLMGVLTSRYASWTSGNRWLAIGGGAILINVALDILVPLALPIPARLGLPRIQYGSLVSYLLWFSLAGYLLIRSWRSFSNTRLPWHANRLLFWVIALMVTFAGEALLLLRWTGLTAAGQATRMIGVLGLTYAISSHRIFDVRTRAQGTLAFMTITFISGAPLAGAVLLVQSLARDEPFGTIIFLTIVTVSIGFLLYVPFQRRVERVVHRYLLGEGVNAGRVVRNYSQSIYRTLDVNQLALVVVGTLNELLEADRGALMLITEAERGYDVEVIPVMGHIGRRKLSLAHDSPIISALAEQHVPLSQYEIDFNPRFANINGEDKEWLNELAMEVYVPVSTGAELVGLIAIGPRRSGVPYQPGELELAQMLADQTVLALRNSRLYSELARQNDRVRHLNVDLVSQNERLEIMDRVKSDFITIASHELRTPLTQVKGYADILNAMNEENNLSREQTRGIVGHINRAALYLESVISAMLDASQIDVEGIRLTFTETSLEAVVRTAMEPLEKAVRERRIRLTAEGFENLPPIILDFNRMVQALSNLIGNAVKYTPDHGSVSIAATIPRTADGKNGYVEIMIADTGIGIDPKYHELIFEKFFRVGDPQLHSTGSTKFKGAGPGLGLPIARGVVEAHGGRVWVESEGEDEGRLPGSRFYIVLPLKPPGSERQAEIGSMNGRSRTTP